MTLKIDEMFAFIAVEEDGEGLPAFQMGDMLMPLVAADSARVDSLRRMAQAICNASGMQMKLVRFSVREELETILPEQGMH